MGAGTAVLTSPPLLAQTSGQNPRPETLECWDAINDAQPERAQLWEKSLAWWRDAKFGMFIHWGPCSLASVEISWPIMVPESKWNITQQEYVNLYKKFNPVQYDPDRWVSMAKAAGQRYMVFTTKHHDGFCMFDSSFTDYKITNTPYKKDIVRILAEACRRQEMPLGFYYSPPDMHHPGFRDTSRPASDNWHGQPTRPEWPLYLNYMELQVRELLCRYGPVVVVWFDGLDHQEKYDGYRFVRMIRELSPGTLVNNRIGVPGDFETPEQWVPKRIPVKGVRITGVDAREAATLPSGLPKPAEFKPWETCMTINDTWAYNKNDRNFKSTKFLIQTLIEVASKGGNFLLNVGPTPEGTIQPEFEERLRGIGGWLKVNGDSIYGTNYGPLQDLSYGRTTVKGKTVYLHVFEWPQGEKLEVPGLQARVEDITLLAGGRRLHFDQSENRLTIDVPTRPRDEQVTVVAIRTA
jgi:alpha-L-fucosidase